MSQNVKRAQTFSTKMLKTHISAKLAALLTHRKQRLTTHYQTESHPPIKIIDMKTKSSTK